jgi:hypothetical protein
MTYQTALKLTGADTMTVAAKVAEIAQQYRPDAIFIDGGGPGGGVVDRLRQLQHEGRTALHHQKPGQPGARVYGRGKRTAQGSEWAMTAVKKESPRLSNGGEGFPTGDQGENAQCRAATSLATLVAGGS